MVSSLCCCCFFITNYLSGLQCKSGPRIILKPGFADICRSHLSIVKKLNEPGNKKIYGTV